MKYKYDENFENEVFEKEQKAARLAARAIERRNRQEWVKAKKLPILLTKIIVMAIPMGILRLLNFQRAKCAKKSIT